MEPASAVAYVAQGIAWHVGVLAAVIAIAAIRRHHAERFKRHRGHRLFVVGVAQVAVRSALWCVAVGAVAAAVIVPASVMLLTQWMAEAESSGETGPGLPRGGLVGLVGFGVTGYLVWKLTIPAIAWVQVMVLSDDVSDRIGLWFARHWSDAPALQAYLLSSQARQAAAEVARLGVEPDDPAQRACFLAARQLAVELRQHIVSWVPRDSLDAALMLCLDTPAGLARLGAIPGWSSWVGVRGQESDRPTAEALEVGDRDARSMLDSLRECTDPAATAAREAVLSATSFRRQTESTWRGVANAGLTAIAAAALAVFYGPACCWGYRHECAAFACFILLVLVLVVAAIVAGVLCTCGLRSCSTDGSASSRSEVARFGWTSGLLLLVGFAVYLFATGRGPAAPAPDWAWRALDQELRIPSSDLARFAENLATDYPDTAKALVRQEARAKAIASWSGRPDMRNFATKVDGQTEVVKLLLDWSDELRKRREGHVDSTPIVLAASRGHADAVKHLLEWGADANAPDSMGSVPGVV